MYEVRAIWTPPKQFEQHQRTRSKNYEMWTSNKTTHEDETKYVAHHVSLVQKSQ
jgi:hypothetical protein